MRILLLGPERLSLLGFLKTFGDEVSRTEERLPTLTRSRPDYDFIVSYGYRHLIRPDWIAAFPQQVVNLHISYLPWNRGSDPNLWSFLDDTPKGVSLHFVDAGLDTGPLIAQREVAMQEAQETLASSYVCLNEAMEELFREHWPVIRAGKSVPVKQIGAGSSHRLKDREAVAHLLTQGWKTPVSELVAAYRAMKEAGIA
ncbi:formyltransferase family protein [Methyloterricola oryzae]|uniref:formyltransferase family protein n=1 Tax=Methyloterricola oryzae TaxID=1495050 RepID=UPI0005EB20A4|nr:formyltransferase family protein [Methyloterricola oryzae]